MTHQGGIGIQHDHMGELLRIQQVIHLLQRTTPFPVTFGRGHWEVHSNAPNEANKKNRGFLMDVKLVTVDQDSKPQETFWK